MLIRRTGGLSNFARVVYHVSINYTANLTGTTVTRNVATYPVLSSGNLFWQEQTAILSETLQYDCLEG